jgi:CDGSH-type Zn-finger protein
MKNIKKNNKRKITVSNNGPYLVTGNIPVESADGEVYEVRNRVALCRCDKSSNKPFCDATHVPSNFYDRKEK